MTNDLRWCLPDDEQVYVERYVDDDGRAFFGINHVFGDGGDASGPYPTRKAAREAALELIARRSRECGWRFH